MQFNQVAGTESGLRHAVFYKNGSQVTAGVLNDTATNDSTAFTLSWVLELVATDYVELFLYQTQGSAVNASGGAGNNYVALEYLGA